MHALWGSERKHMLHRIAHTSSLKFLLLRTAVGCEYRDASCQWTEKREEYGECGGMRFPVSRIAGLSDIVLGREVMQVEDEGVWVYDGGMLTAWCRVSVACGYNSA
jgi:hypothetical protein